MSKIMTVFIVIVLMSGCATVFTRFEKYKEQSQNTILVKISCTITSAKNIVRQVIKESNLFVERPQLEKDNFIFANTGYGNYCAYRNELADKIRIKALELENK